MGDRTRLEQVAANLIDNALKYTPPGGRVEVEIGATAGSASSAFATPAPASRPTSCHESSIGCSAATRAGPSVGWVSA